MKEHHWGVSAALMEQMLGTGDLGRQLFQARESEGGGGRAPGKPEGKGAG